MQPTQSNTIGKNIDSYSMLIISKYFMEKIDFINVICVCKKFKETTEKLRFNPIPITSLTLFPKIQTQYLYSKGDERIKGIDNYEIWHKVNYDQYLQYKEYNIKCHYINYTKENRLKYGNEIPDCVNTISLLCFFDCDILKSINLPSTITSLGDNCFGFCRSLTTISFPSSLKSIGNYCFYKCSSLSSINLPSSLTSLSENCFSHCLSLTSINLPSSLQSLSDDCFNGCYSLQTINLPSLLKSLGNYCFCNCSSLTPIDLPSSLTSLGNKCFFCCSSLTSINLPSSLSSLSDECFYECVNLQTINLPYGIRIGKKCFTNCYKSNYYKKHSFCIIS